MGKLIQEVYKCVLDMDSKEIKQKVQTALDSGEKAEDILNEGLIAAMSEVGRLFEDGEYFVPEMLISARVMQSGLSVLRPILVENDVKPTGKVIIGTVKGDLHDIGKNLVSMMLEGVGFQVIDLGTDVAPETFLEAIKTHQPDIVGMSALLTTTMQNIDRTIKFLKDNNIRSQVKVIIGGAPVTQKYADEVGADGFSPDANQAAVLAKRLMGLA